MVGKVGTGVLMMTNKTRMSDDVRLWRNLGKFEMSLLPYVLRGSCFASDLSQFEIVPGSQGWLAQTCYAGANGAIPMNWRESRWLQERS